MSIAKEVEAWCLERGDRPTYRIVCSGYEGEYQALVEAREFRHDLKVYSRHTGRWAKAPVVESTSPVAGAVPAVDRGAAPNASRSVMQVGYTS